ncbi:MAG: hypothetical protein PUF56_00030 [Lachnospiraceae bacterium]|nr:hypothetical protein [Lachnospiraceae bacterium]
MSTAKRVTSKTGQQQDKPTAKKAAVRQVSSKTGQQQKSQQKCRARILPGIFVNLQFVNRPYI